MAKVLPQNKALRRDTLFHNIVLIIEKNPENILLYAGFLEPDELRKVLDAIPQTKLYLKG